MKIITNQKKINRNSKIGYWVSISSPLILMLSAWILYKDPLNIVPALILLTVGFLGFSIGMAFKKYSSGEDRILDQVLKKLGKGYTLYHFATPVSHLLVGPAGIWILVIKSVPGIVTYNDKKKKWQLGQENTAKKALSLFSEGIGTPGKDISAEAQALDRYLRKNWKNEEEIFIQAALVMIHPETVVNADNAPVPTVHAMKLRSFIRQQEKNNTLSNTLLREFNQLFTDNTDQNEETKIVDSEESKDTD